MRGARRAEDAACVAILQLDLHAVYTYNFNAWLVKRARLLLVRFNIGLGPSCLGMCGAWNNARIGACRSQQIQQCQQEEQSGADYNQKTKGHCINAPIRQATFKTKEQGRTCTDQRQRHKEHARITGHDAASVAVKGVAPGEDLPFPFFLAGRPFHLFFVRDFLTPLSLSYHIPLVISVFKNTL